MRRPAAPLLLLAALLPAAGAPAAPASLDASLSRLVDGSRIAADRISLAVVDPRDGSVLAEHRGRETVTPASCLKAATTAAAFVALGPRFPLRTRLLALPPSGGGDPSVVAGDLWLVGRGDPGFSEHGPEGGTRAALDAFAGQAAARGVRRVRGDLVLDTSYFSGPRVHATWSDVGPAAHWYAAEVDALTVNDGCVDVAVEPGGAAGAAGRLTLFPESTLVTAVNRVVTVGDRREHGFGFRLSAEGNTLEVSGKVWTGSSGAKAPAAVHDPALLCAEQVGRALARAGIRVEGAVRRPRAGESPPAGAAVLAEHATPLSLACAVANTRSQNLWAETILRVLGAERYGEGSFGAGARAVRGALAPAGPEIEAGLLPVDGSGLSRGNAASALALCRAMALVWKGEGRDAYFGGMARPGVGTLDDRFAEKRFRGRLFAKTGTLRGVSGLCGLAVGPEARPRIFAVLAGEGIPVWRARALQDAVVAALVGE